MFGAYFKHIVVWDALLCYGGAAIASLSGDRDSPMTRRRSKIESHNRSDGENQEPTQEAVEEFIVIDGTPEEIADAMFSKGALKRSRASSNPEGGVGSAGSSARRRRLV